MSFLRAALLAVLLLGAVTGQAEVVLVPQPGGFPIPEGYTLINDYEHVLQPQDRVRIERRMRDLERRNGTQIVFLSVPDTGTEGAGAYSARVFEKWNIGNNHEGNGVLILAGNDDVAILVGPGIAGALPDVLVARLRSDILYAAYQRGDQSGGMAALIDAMVDACLGEQTKGASHDYSRRAPSASAWFQRQQELRWIAVLTAIGVVSIGVLLWRRRKGTV